ncbi:hypothetical protein BDW74DRAFT_172664 [Aspergillus multicolor]|uniref:uncharacterized protein n=1 Tax=Aspergillus multicolor TaxID=41759 RepID=UPI003CCCD930
MSFHLTSLVLFLLGLLTAQPVHALFRCTGTALACRIQLNRSKNPPPASRSADCSSYQLTTVTPAPTAITTTVETVITTITVTVDPNLAARTANPARAIRQTTATPTALPAYVFGPCLQPGAYGSACSCLGIPGSTSTAATPTSLISVTTTVTETVTVTPTPPPCANPATCGGFNAIECPSGPFNFCACGFNDDGEATCIAAVDYAAAAACTRDEECGEGNVCQTGTCCETPVCAPLGVGCPLAEEGADLNANAAAVSEEVNVQGCNGNIISCDGDGDAE